jgi:hypothetical protein
MTSTQHSAHFYKYELAKYRGCNLDQSKSLAYLSQEVWRSTTPRPSRTSAAVRLLTLFSNLKLKHPLCRNQIMQENFASIHWATTNMKKITNQDFGRPNPKTSTSAITRRRSNTKRRDQERRSRFEERVLQIRTWKWRIATSRTGYQRRGHYSNRFEWENNVPTVHGNYILFFMSMT